MIKKWKISNFKSIYEGTELEIAPLTIFAGPNSSGKSSFIQSILLAAQTMAHKVSSRSVVLNGAFAHLGQFDDLCSNNSSEKQITIACTCAPCFNKGFKLGNTAAYRRGTIYGSASNQIVENLFEITFDAGFGAGRKDIFQIQPRLVSCDLKTRYINEDGAEKKAFISIKRLEDHSLKNIEKEKWLGYTAEADEVFEDSLKYELLIDDQSLEEIKQEFKSADIIGCFLMHFLPEKLILGVDTVKERAAAAAFMLQEHQSWPVNINRHLWQDIELSGEVLGILKNIAGYITDFDKTFFDDLLYKRGEQNGGKECVSLKSFLEKVKSLPGKKRFEIRQRLAEAENLYEIIYAALIEKTNDKDRFEPVYYRLPKTILESAWYIDNFFASCIKYLGPLRDAPKPLYPVMPALDPYDTGLKGEHTAAVLEMHKHKKIKYIPSANFKAPEIEKEAVCETLEKAVADWLRYLDVAESVTSRDQGKLGHELKVNLTDSSQPHDLTHVGVGVSQVLPILVMCLLSDNDNTIVLEQPELHLHPKVQALMGDFFLSIAFCGKQCIVETHSEYLIDRLRFRTAACKEKDSLNSDLKIYFAEKKDSRSVFKKVIINDYGAITNWPDGFFDQSQREAEAILKAALLKRRSQGK